MDMISETQFDQKYGHKTDFPRDAWFALRREWREAVPSETYALVDEGVVNASGHEMVTLFFTDAGFAAFTKVVSG